MKNIKGIIGAAVLLLSSTSCIQAQPLLAATDGLQPVSSHDLPRHSVFWLAKGPGGKPAKEADGQPSGPYLCLPPFAFDLPVFALGDRQFLIDDTGVDYGEPIPHDKLPRFATFWLMKTPFGVAAPYPCLPFVDPDVSVFALGKEQFLVDDSGVDYGAKSQWRSMARTSTTFSFEDGGSPEDAGEESSTDTRRNYAKFQGQIFSLVDTNNAAVNDTNLYNALLLFPDDTGTNATLQIAAYGTDAVIIKANHFDYSAETDRDFALLVCDKIETPVWKDIDFQGLSDSQDGWLVQGSVPNWKVTDPMYFQISNISRDANAFFQVIPYGGSQVVLSGPQPYDTVSNTIAIQATIADLSGTTNAHFDVTVDGLPARYSVETNNNISLNTKYNPAGGHNVDLQVSSRVSVYDPINAPVDIVFGWDAMAIMPLDFENDNYVVSISSYATPEIGTNWFLFYVTKEQDVDCKIINPANGQVVMYYTNHVPAQTTVEVPWNFTETNGITPYTNDTYVIRFTAYDPDTFDGTNSIDRTGVRNPAGCFITYQVLDSYDPDASYLNQKADTWLYGNLRSLYRDLYKSTGLTQYGAFQVGTNRNHSDCIPLVGSLTWEGFMKPAMSNLFYSDLTIGQAHGGAVTIGGAPSDKFYTITLNDWIMNGTGVGPNWRLRKAAFWSCSCGHYDPPYMTFPEACGVRPAKVQESSYIRKNCALIFKSALYMGGYPGGEVSAQVAAYFDTVWVAGKNAYPGGCDPTYSFDYALRRTKAYYGNQLAKAIPFIEGYKFMIYSSVYDDELLLLNASHVKTH